MPCSPATSSTWFAAAACLAALSLGACSDASGGDLDTWCATVQRSLTTVLAVDFDAFEAGDPEALENAAVAEQAGIDLRESDPPAEIREAFELAIDPAGFGPDSPPEYGDARDEVEAYVLANCDLPADLEEQLREPG